MNIGKSDLEVSGIALGANPFGWTADEATTYKILDAFADAGGNMIDTADVYSAWAPGNQGGESESAMKRWLSANREKVLVATKVGQKPDRKGLAPENIRKAAQESAERMGVEQIDLYYAHEDDPEVPMDEFAHAFSELAEEGLIREIGISNFEPTRFTEWMQIAKKNGFRAPVAMQPHYNLVTRADFEDERAPIAREYNLAVFPYFSLASGFLTGKYKRDEPVRGDRKDMVAPYLNDQAFDTIDQLKAIADKRSVTPGAVALAWLHAQDTVAAPLASARNTEQLEQIMVGATLQLDPDEVEALTKVSQGL